VKVSAHAYATLQVGSIRYKKKKKEIVMHALNVIICRSKCKGSNVSTSREEAITISYTDNEHKKIELKTR